MKTLKLTIAALILACTVQVASAQVRVGLRIGPPPPRRVVVVGRPYGYHRAYYRHAYYGRPYYAHYHHGYYTRHW